MARLTWYGHAAFKLELDGLTVLIDPWITNPLSPYRSVDSFVKDVKNVDLIVVTHSHGDHVGDTVELLKRYKQAKVLAIFELAEHLGREAGDINRAIGANIGGPARFGSLRIVLTPAHHSSSIGDPAGVVIIGEKEQKAVYHAGDTGLVAEMQFIGELYRLDVALLPIGGHFTMGPLEAAKAAELLKPRMVVPMHYNTFDVIAANPEEFAKLVRERNPETRVVILKPGESLDF